jgi:hypothetical protein
MTLVAAFPEQPDDGNGLLKAFLPYLGLRPASAEDVLVEVLARPDAEKEASFHHRRRGGATEVVKSDETVRCGYL